MLGRGERPASRLSTQMRDRRPNLTVPVAQGSIRLLFRQTFSRSAVQWSVVEGGSLHSAEARQTFSHSGRGVMSKQPHSIGVE